MSNGQPPRVHSRFIPQEEIDDSTVVQWRFGTVDAQGGAFTPMQPAPFVPAGAQFNERLFMAGNQLGKTKAGGADISFLGQIMMSNMGNPLAGLGQ